MLRRLDWEIWLDCHISPIIAKWLKDDTGFVVKSSFILKLHGLDDPAIYALAKQNPVPVIFVSKDSDLPQSINLYGSPPKLISVKMGNCDNRVLFQFLRNNLEEVLKRLIDSDADVVELIP